MKTLFEVLFCLLLGVLILLISASFAAAQNVGINNPAPHNKSLLDLTSTDKGLLAPRMTQSQRLFMFPAADASAKGMLVYQTDNVQGFYYYDGTAWQYIANGNAGWGLSGNGGTTPATNFIGTTDNSDLLFKTNGAETMRMLTNKKIGIGTTTPGQYYSATRMEIADEDGLNSDITIRVAGLGFPVFAFMKQRGTLAAPAVTMAGDVTGALVNYAYDGTKFMYSSGISFLLDSNAALNDVAGSIRFYTANNNLTPEVMRISSLGQVGIGNSNPAHPLSFANTLGDKISLWGGAGNHYGFGIQGSLLQIHSAGIPDDIAFGYGSSAAFTERVRFKGNGNVGIGTSAPAVKLHLVDSAWIIPMRIQNRMSNGYSCIQFINSNSSGWGHVGFANPSASNFTDRFFVGSITSHPVVFSTVDVERMRLDVAGNLGIGTPTPAAKLDVAGTVKITDGTQGVGKVLTSDATGLATWQSLNAGSVNAWSLTGNAGTNPANHFVGTSDAAELHFRTSNIDRMIVSALGYVGINTVPLATSQFYVQSNVNAIFGSSTSTTAAAVSGMATANTGSGKGVYGASDADGGSGVYGINFSTTGVTVGTYGAAGSTTGYGIQGIAFSGTGVNYGVYGSSASASGYNGFFTGTGRFASMSNSGFQTNTPQTVVDINGGLTVRDSIVTVDAALVNVTVGNRSYIRVNSTGTPAARLISLSNGLQTGQILMIECIAAVGTNGVRLSDNAATYNTNLVTYHDMYQNDVITLLWNGTDWIETAYANN